MDNNLILPFLHGINEKYKNIQNDNIKTQQTNKQLNKHTSKQTSKLSNTRIGVIRGVITPLRPNQPTEPSCSSTFCYSVWCNTTANHQLKLPQQDFGNLYSISYVKMFIHSCVHAKQWAQTTTIAVWYLDTF